MDGLELRVRERRMDERRQRVVVQELLPGAEAVHAAGRAAAARSWRRRACSPPDRSSSGLRRNSPGVAVSPRTPRISLSCSSRTRRSDSGSVAQPLHPVLERDDVVADLAQIRRAALDGDRPPRPRAVRRASPACPRCGSTAPPRGGRTAGSADADSAAAAPRRRADRPPDPPPKAPPPARRSTRSAAAAGPVRRPDTAPAADQAAVRLPVRVRRHGVPYLRP